jgi:arsenate reductase-like glutaredoxin family protein
MARDARRVIVAKGKKVLSFDLKKDAPDDATLLKHLLGTSGNLRAPTLIVGDVLLVGFNDEAYSEALK